MTKEIDSSKRRIVEELKERNKDNLDLTASEYYGNKFSYADTFQMFEDYKKAFISLDGVNRDPITISAPTIVSSVNAMYGTFDANKIANLTSPGFLYTYPEKYITELGSKTVVIFDGFLHEEFVKRLHNAGVKNVIITSITDYMNPMVRKIAGEKGLIKDVDFLDAYVKSGKELPKDMQFIRMSEFAKAGHEIKENIDFPYEENQIAAYFLTGATTSRHPKGVKLYQDGFNNMATVYDKLWFDFPKGIRHTQFIPLFYATGAVHGVHASLFSNMTMSYCPKYDRFAFANDLKNTHANIALVAPSHVATLANAGLHDGELDYVDYIFIGGEAIMPAQMKKFRETAHRLGIKHVINGYGMTETGSMSGISEENPKYDGDVTVYPVPGASYRVVDPDTREVLPNNTKGILEKTTPCQTAGYLDEEKNKELFTPDHWINTGDVAEKYDDGSFRVFGRGNDYFVNNGHKYYMFEIEEKVLEHPGILEAEVTKFTVGSNEYPSLVVVLKPDWENRAREILEYVQSIKVPGINMLIGTKFIEKFKTNPVTAKRDYLSLADDKNGYYKIVGDLIKTDILEDRFNCEYVKEEDIVIEKEDVKSLKRVK